ncbi:unnamed protein product [Fusarium fujikuroi]|uniref:Uncharacterized protein n=1 Tax=Fusarium fujikuroi TaxID=5127 RepID=A0A9Q9REU0_FUSFU|nr:unnamed protein product [Fusarium fujikuroi]VTT84569.1 unnamed protein product [Fusarium fujikuroi]VZI09404.1 unnamed protein product [Fusarium fujikuroi]
MASQGRDRLILREEIISDDKVASSRHPNTVLHNHRMLRKEEKLALIQHAREYAWVLVHQRGQTTANSKKLLKKFYAEIFLHWSTSQRRNPNPSSTYPEDLQTLVGSIKKTCSKEAGNAITQKCGEPAYLSLRVNEHAESIENGWSIVPGRIEFEPGLTVTQAKINAIHNYDNHERRRISSYNTQHIICATRSILVKWAARGSEGPLKLESEDMVSRIQPLVLASDLARYMAFTYSQIVEDMDGGSEDRTDDPDSD